MKKYKILVWVVALFAYFQSCSVEPTYYSEVTPELFFDTQDKVYQRMGRAFTHWAWYMADNQTHSNGRLLSEFTTDAMLVPSRWNDWFDGGRYLTLYQHTWTPAISEIWDGWRGFSMGIAQALSARDDIDMYVDFEGLRFPAGAREQIYNQLNSLVAYFALTGLDWFGGIPIYDSNNDPPKPRATDVETFQYIEKLLLDAIPHLPKKTVLGAAETGAINQAAAALMLARLYFNAESYTRQNKYADAAKVSQDIIDGVYGAYKLEDDWRSVFGYTNSRSTEIIWAVPSVHAVSERSVGTHSYHYSMGAYWDNGTVGSRNNGYSMTPSLDVDGKSYLWGSDDPSPKGPFRLGSPFAKFHEQDVRKQIHAFNPEIETHMYQGMFFFGDMINPVTGGRCMGGNRQVPPTQLLTIVDQIARLIVTTDANYRSEGARWADENSGVRLVKFSPVPWASHQTLRGNPHIPVFRLAEVYYMLAECKLRANDKAGAATLINEVRKRYFVDADPDPATADNLDEWRMLDEWLREFIGEGRRRTDLIRWNKFTTESWWDKPATNKSHLNRFPIPERAINSNNLLEQNSGYE